MERDNKIIIDNPIIKKKPPKLKALDRSISIAIENYTPSAPTMIIDDSLILEEPLPPPPRLTKADTIYFVSGGSTSPIAYDDCPHHIKKSTNFRRSDTLDVHSPSNFQMRKTHSFHSNEPTVEEFLLSRRTSSVRGSYLFPQMPVREKIERSPDPNRRSCRMHRSFNEQTKRPSTKDGITIQGIRYPSLNDDILHQDFEPKMQSFTSANVSVDNEIFRSRSNSRTKVDDETFFEVVSSNASNRNKHPHKHSSHSLDQQQQYNFKRGSKHTHSLYLSPNSFEELQVHRSLQGNKKSHSASMRIRPYKETLSATKKSKSFMIDTYPEFELSPRRRESRILTTDDIKRSPRPSTAASSLSHHAKEARSSFDRNSSLNYDVRDVEFEQVLRPFRQSRRRSSIRGSVKNVKKKSIPTDEDDDDESDRKRKKIVCIIMTVFLCLVCASVFVVIITLTHSSVAQVQNQTRKVYTFSRESPIHYNVRQENERLMQESMNRGRFVKNFTEAAQQQQHQQQQASEGEIP